MASSHFCSIPHHIIKYNKRKYYKDMLANNNIEEKFTSIFEHNLWGSVESISGTGNEIKYTENLRKWLIDFCTRSQIKTIVDAPCGDFNWMREVLPMLNVHYNGFDIVIDVVEKNSARFGAQDVIFSHANICIDKLPACDLLIIRDCLLDLSYNDINLLLGNIKTCDYKFLLTTTHLLGEWQQNNDIVTGDFREIDLFKAPFYFPRDKVKEEVKDSPGKNEVPRKMILIAKDDVPNSIFTSVLL